VTKKTQRSITYLFRLYKLNTRPVEEVATGKLTVVCVTRGADGRMKAVPIPEVIAKKIQVAPKKLLAGA
jgi:acyl-CoA thioesterase FadM